MQYNSLLDFILVLFHTRSLSLRIRPLITTIRPTTLTDNDQVRSVSTIFPNTLIAREKKKKRNIGSTRRHERNISQGKLPK